MLFLLLLLLFFFFNEIPLNWILYKCMPNNMFENFKYNVDHHYNSIHEYFLLTAVAVVVQKMIFRQETSTAKEMIHAPASMYHD